MVVTIEVPAQRLQVQAEPVPLPEALAASVDGHYTGVVEMPLHAYAAAHARDAGLTFERCLARLLVENGRPYDVRHRVLAVSPDSRSVYLEATLDVVAMVTDTL